jgi:hypothetical protein
MALAGTPFSVDWFDERMLPDFLQDRLRRYHNWQILGISEIERPEVGPTKLTLVLRSPNRRCITYIRFSINITGHEIIREEEQD